MSHTYVWWSVPELRRMKQLADAGMSYSAIAIALRVDFGTERTADTVRCALVRHFPGFRSPRPAKGRQFKAKAAA